MPSILGANTLSSGYDVANSVRFDDGDSAYLQKSASGGNRKTFTFSTWLKRGNLTYGYATFFSSDQATNNSFRVTFDDDDGSNDDHLMVYYYTGSHQLKFITNREFRDISAWYHIVIAVDTTQGTEGNRLKIYVNGVQETAFSTASYPSQNLDTSVNQSGAPTRVGAGTSLYFDGYMAETVLIDGTQYAASDFGEFDSDSGIWKPKDVSGLTFGTNGFYLNYENAAELGTDANGGTALSETNLDAQNQSTDTCTNNFATLNHLNTHDGALTYSEGNLKVVAASGSAAWNTRYAFSTIGVSAGRWYVEAKCVDSGGSNQFYFGVGKDLNTWTFTSSLGYENTGQGWGYYASSGNIVNNESDLYTSGNSYTDGDIISMELDLEDMTLDFYKNGAKEGYQITSLPAGTYHFAINGYAAIDGEFNFGSPPYAISSGNADGNGHGNFEYSVPSGHFALNTKNLAEHG